MAEQRAVGRPWSAREDQLLAAAVAVHGDADHWKAVALAVPGRSNKACRKRWLHSLSPSVKKSAWTKDEDDLLLELYKIHAAKWAVIARNIPGRTDDACSKRYREALDPRLKKDDWSPAEDDRLLAAHARLGGRWGRVGHELQRSGLGCRNRWRLLQRKRAASRPSSQPVPAHPDPSWSMIDASPYWDDSLSLPSRNSVDLLSDPSPQQQHAQLAPQLVDYPAPFHYSSSSLSSALSPQHAVPYEKDADATASNGRQSLLLPTSSAPPDSLFAPFDYDDSSSTCALSVGSTSPAPQPPPYSEDMHQNNIYSDAHHPFHQLQRPVPHASIPAHASAHAIQVDHYTPSIAHEERTLSHAALSTRHLPTPQNGCPLRAPSSADPFFAPSPQQANHMSSSMSSAPLLDKPDTYYHPSSEPQLDVNPHHALSTPDPLALSESRPAYHYAHQRDHSRARGVESMHGPEQHGDYHHNHVQAADRRGHLPSRPATSSETRYALHPSEPRGLNSPQPEPGPSRTTPDVYYRSQPIRRPASSPQVGMPYSKRPPPDVSSHEEGQPCHPATKQKTGAPRKRADKQVPLRLSSDLPATSDPSIKPYACGHESCWPSTAGASRASYGTSRGLSDHNKAAHPDDSGGDRPYRCGLEGCGKSWKSINGLQYHLQISKAHFQHAITSSIVSTYIGGLSVPASVKATNEGDDKTKKQYKCPHENCPNRYKQLSGLRYHLAHGHPVDLPKQLDLVPPALSRKLAEKMRGQGPMEAPGRSSHSEGSSRSLRSFDA